MFVYPYLKGIKNLDADANGVGLGTESMGGRNGLLMKPNYCVT